MGSAWTLGSFKKGREEAIFESAGRRELGAGGPLLLLAPEVG